LIPTLSVPRLFFHPVVEEKRKGQLSVVHFEKSGVSAKRKSRKDIFGDNTKPFEFLRSDIFTRNQRLASSQGLASSL